MGRVKVRWVAGPLVVATALTYALAGPQEGSAQEGSAQDGSPRTGTVTMPPMTQLDPCPNNRTEVDHLGVARVYSGDRLCAVLPPGIVHLRAANLDSFGVNHLGRPHAFLEDDGGLRVDCEAPTIWCDDEGA